MKQIEIWKFTLRETKESMAPKTFIAPMPSQTDSTNVKLKERCSDADAAHFRQKAGSLMQLCVCARSVNNNISLQPLVIRVPSTQHERPNYT